MTAPQQVQRGAAIYEDYMYMSVGGYTHTHIYIYTYIYIYVYIYVYACVYVYLDSYIYIYTHVYLGMYMVAFVWYVYAVPLFGTATVIVDLLFRSLVKLYSARKDRLSLEVFLTKQQKSSAYRGGFDSV